MRSQNVQATMFCVEFYMNYSTAYKMRIIAYVRELYAYAYAETPFAYSAHCVRGDVVLL